MLNTNINPNLDMTYHFGCNGKLLKALTVMFKIFHNHKKSAIYTV